MAPSLVAIVGRWTDVWLTGLLCVLIFGIGDAIFRRGELAEPSFIVALGWLSAAIAAVATLLAFGA